MSSRDLVIRLWHVSRPRALVSALLRPILPVGYQNAGYDYFLTDNRYVLKCIQKC